MKNKLLIASLLIGTALVLGFFVANKTSTNNPSIENPTVESAVPEAPKTAEDYFDMGEAYLYGIEVEEDFHKAEEMYRKAADMWHAESHFKLSLFYLYWSSPSRHF